MSPKHKEAIISLSAEYLKEMLSANAGIAITNHESSVSISDDPLYFANRRIKGELVITVGFELFEAAATKED